MFLFEYQNPVKYIFGRGRLETIGDEAAKLGNKALIVTYGDAIFAGLAERVKSYLASRKVESILFDKATQNPLNTTVREGADIAVREGCTVVIGLGGGSAMDSAKGIAFMAGKEGDIFDYIFGAKTGAGALPVIAVTTTAGTGSEGNSTAVFTNVQTKDKKGIVNPAIFPKVAILDPELMTTLPKKLIAGPGMDAMFHAFESFISKKSSPMSRMYSCKAMELSANYLPKVYNDPSDLDSWDHVVLANTLAGIAIGAAACTAPHALGQPVSGLLDIPHADTLIGVYIPFMKFTAPHAPEKFAYLAGLLGCDTANMTMGEAALSSHQYMEAFLQQLGCAKTLGDLGVKEEHIDWLAHNATEKMGPVLANNPIVPDIEQVKKLYRQSL